jgi:hypothetical protein
MTEEGGRSNSVLNSKSFLMVKIFRPVFSFLSMVLRSSSGLCKKENYTYRRWFSFILNHRNNKVRHVYHLYKISFY